MSYITQDLACTAPNGMGPLSEAEASLLAAPPGLSTSYLPGGGVGTGYVASPSSTDVTAIKNGNAGALSTQGCGPDAQTPNQPFYASNYPDSTAKLVNSINPFEYLYGGGGAACGARRISSPSWNSRKTCRPAPVRRTSANEANALTDCWPWLLGIAGFILLVGLPNGK